MSETRDVLLGAHLEERLGEALERPEPMCLFLVTIESPSGVLSLVEDRLDSNLRAYDQLWRLDDTSHIILLKTMADAGALDAKVNQLFTLLTTPYPIDGKDVSVTVRLAGAVRTPSDDAESLLDRIDKALRTADEIGRAAPVVL